VRRAYPSIDEAWGRLRDHLGPDFDPSLKDYAACCEHTDAEFRRLGPRFYEESTGYLYDLTHFHFMACKEGFFGPLTEFARAHGLRRLADFGCGAGLDGQMLLQQGLAVEFHDIPSPSTRYLAWRLRRDQGMDVTVRGPLEAGAAPYDLAYAMDVVEHVPSPVPFLRHLFCSARYVCVNLFGHDSGPGAADDMHYPLNHWALLPQLSEWGTVVQVGVSGDTVVTLWRSRLQEPSRP
jgi:hypothetical protein